MKGLPFHNHPRSVGAQIDRMRSCWPDFQVRRRSNDAVMWGGLLRGFQRYYTVGVIWDEQFNDKPYVYLIDPPLTPREGTTFEQIPHLMYDAANPELSGLCLFDPEGKEWSNHMLIADTTLPWAAEWLFYYELWHYEGTWRGGGVGYESVAEARDKAIHEQTGEHSSDSTGALALADE